MTSRSFPTAFCQTCPRNRGGMPFHHIFLCEARSSAFVISVAQLGRRRVDQYSALIRVAFSRARASSWARCASSRSASSMRANIFWYSLRCFFSSFGSLGGSQDGRVLERYFCFSTEGWNGSIRGSLFRTGGSGAFLDFGSGWFSDADLASPGCCRLTSCILSISVWKSSSFSVSFFASASRVV